MRVKPLILDVDDDEAGRYAVSRQLTQAGYEMRGAGNGAQGLEIAARERPDLIILDVRLPDIDGFEVCRRIRAMEPIAETPVIQMSASYIDTTSRVKGLENGADAYLVEPVEPAILLATVNSLLRMKRAEQEVRRGALRWQATFNAIQDGIALLDVDGRTIRANEAFERSGGSELEAAVRVGMMRELRNTGRRQTGERTWNERLFAITLDPVIGEKGEFEGAVCILADITERRQFEEHLQQTQRLESLGVLAGGIAHDFNNLLTGILGNASLLMDSLPESSAQFRMAREIERASHSAADLTRQILAYSGKGRVATRQIDFSTVVLEMHSFVVRFVPAHVELVYDTAAHLPPVLADKGQMQQLLMNLIINAAESFENNSKGVVRVGTGAERLDDGFFRPGEARAPGEYVWLEVSDNGIGMDEATQKRIFDPFFTTKFAGRGLGLSAVHGILNGHGGLLRLQSRPGVGTTFRVYFPAVAGEHTAPGGVPEPMTDPRTATILVVDDEAAVRAFATTALRVKGHQVLVARSGQEALELFGIDRRGIDLVLLDLTMPFMSGEETLERLRSVDPRTPVILSSGYNLTQVQERFEGKGVVGFLWKPYTSAELDRAVQRALKPIEKKR